MGVKLGQSRVSLTPPARAALVEGATSKATATNPLNGCDRLGGQKVASWLEKRKLVLEFYSQSQSHFQVGPRSKAIKAKRTLAFHHP